MWLALPSVGGRMYSLSPCVYCAYRLFLACKVTDFFKGLGSDESMWHRLQQSGVLAPESVVSTLATVVLIMSIYSIVIALFKVI